ncbi:hypothetical protein I7I53_11818 [Histoplasma capsulatum var. duboisii H88]|uniref:Uncharacterized protein n=1 Tax=Ajellomyces capsulatus (strain H88) TaxID=544711 RepID=A0A8A1LUJ4_AJEC8|nr:hypothetical protein I7I53_11818 [Histoplasma capsulatum var. duboisii H88]
MRERNAKDTITSDLSGQIILKLLRQRRERFDGLEVEGSAKGKLPGVKRGQSRQILYLPFVSGNVSP